MCMPPAERILGNTLKACITLQKKNIENISMGMSNDYKEAIICGEPRLEWKLIFGKRGNNYYENNLLWKGPSIFESLESLSKIKKVFIKRIDFKKILI